MAVHGTRRRESVSWDYAGLTQFLAGLASEQSGLPLLRCYWYEATVEGRRTEEHDTLADLPGVKLRLAKMRPGRREGVESEIHRDLTTLARNKAATDAMVVSAEEDLAQVVADVQDLGMRVTLLHIAVDGNGAIPRALRQECDDVAEINSAHLRPYVELISGAEPPRTDEQDAGSLIVFRPAANGHGQPAGTAPYPPAPQETDNGYQAPPGYPASADALAGALSRPRPPLDLAPVAQDVQQEQQDSSACSAAAWSARAAACPARGGRRAGPASRARRGPPRGVRRRRLLQRVARSCCGPAGAGSGPAFAVFACGGSGVCRAARLARGTRVHATARGVRRPGGRSRATRRAAGRSSGGAEPRHRSVRVPPRCHPHAAATRSGEPGAAASRAR